MLARILAPFRDERGNSIVEYALIVSLIAMVCLAGMTVLGSSAKNQLSSAATSIMSSSAPHSNHHRE